jgi:adenosylmethionine-8-amino-7-oxononanoate aminotransferase
MSCLGEVEEAMDRYGEKIAAVVMEPLIQAAAGMITFPPGYTRRVRELAAKHEILFIADEVATGFGRTGALFACDREEIEPDFMTLAKGITGGYLPMAATLTSQKIFDAFFQEYRAQKTFSRARLRATPRRCSGAANEVFERKIPWENSRRSDSLSR